MKTFCKTLCCLFLLYTSALFGDDLERLKEIKLKLWPQAYRTQDATLLGSILHPSFELIGNDGKISTREDELKYVENNPWNPEEFTYTIDRLEIFDKTFAIITGRGSTQTYRYTSSNYFIKKDERWQAISSHVSGFEMISTDPR